MTGIEAVIEADAMARRERIDVAIVRTRLGHLAVRCAIEARRSGCCVLEVCRYIPPRFA